MIDGISVGRDPQWFDMSGQGAALMQLMQMNQQLMQQLAHDRGSKLSGRDGDDIRLEITPPKKRKVIVSLCRCVQWQRSYRCVGVCSNSDRISVQVVCVHVCMCSDRIAV